MEWSKDKTLKLIELLQVNASLWNPSLCDTRRDKQKRREELRSIAEILGISVSDATKKIQHLRTQYNREWAREARAHVEDPNDRYVSNWYAFEYLHFLKYSNKPYKVFQSDENPDVNGLSSNSDSAIDDCKLSSLSPPHKISRIDPVASVKSETVYPPLSRTRDEFSVFGEYIANELRSLKGERNLLVAKKRIQDVIFDVKIGMIGDLRADQGTLCTVFTNTTQPHNTTIHNSKLYNTPVMSTTANIEPLSTSHTPSTTGISEIIINSACHYSNFKVDTQ